MVVVFEPHTFSWRNQDALAWYDTVFEGVEQVLLLPPPTHGAKSHDQLSQDQIAARVRQTGVPVIPVGDRAETIAALAAALKGDEVLLLLSSGPLDGLAEAAPVWLDKTFGA